MKALINYHDITVQSSNFILLCVIHIFVYLVLLSSGKNPVSLHRWPLIVYSIELDTTNTANIYNFHFHHKANFLMFCPYLVCLLVCFRVFFSSHLRIFYSYEDVTIVGEGLQIFTNAWHSWSLSSESNFACHIFCDTVHPFIISISEDPWHSHLLPSFWLWSCHYLFLRLRSVAARIRTLNIQK